MTAVAEPYSVVAVRIARPWRSPRTLTSPFSTESSAMLGSIDHCASAIGDPDESTTERPLYVSTSSVSLLGVIETEVDAVVCANTAGATGASNSTIAKSCFADELCVLHHLANVIPYRLLLDRSHRRLALVQVYIKCHILGYESVY